MFVFVGIMQSVVLRVSCSIHFVLLSGKFFILDLLLKFNSSYLFIYFCKYLFIYLFILFIYLSIYFHRWERSCRVNLLITFQALFDLSLQARKDDHNYLFISPSYQ